MRRRPQRRHVRRRHSEIEPDLHQLAPVGVANGAHQIAASVVRRVRKLPDEIIQRLGVRYIDELACQSVGQL
jgi:hypothetical protein